MNNALIFIAFLIFGFVCGVVSLALVSGKKGDE